MCLLRDRFDNDRQSFHWMNNGGETPHGGFIVLAGSLRSQYKKKNVWPKLSDVTTF